MPPGETCHHVITGLSSVLSPPLARPLEVETTGDRRDGKADTAGQAPAAGCREKALPPDVLGSHQSGRRRPCIRVRCSRMFHSTFPRAAEPITDRYA